MGRALRPLLLAGCLLLGTLACSSVPPLPAPDPDTGWREFTVESTLDGSEQPVRLHLPADAPGPLPLVLHLHTWSGDLHQQMFVPEVEAGCATRGWALLVPNFRGPNRSPEACASPLAVQDVLDALDHVGARVEVGPVYVHGVSGGGHMALVLAARAPRRWAGVSAWVPISDLERWHGETKAAGHPYWQDLEAVFGGPPDAGLEAEYRARSPLFELSRAGGVALDLNAGIRDGHEGSVPVGHSLRAFDVLAAANGQSEACFGEEHIARYERWELLATPRSMEGRRHPVLVRREAGPARITLFDGGHEGDPAAALGWFDGLDP